METLTERQAEILDFINDTIKETGYPPTLQEIAMAMGFRSPNAARDHLLALERKGALELDPGTSRGIRTLQGQGLPVVGKVAAGQPILAEQNIEKHYRVEADMFNPKADYLLLVRGASMEGAGILNKDLLVVHSTTQARNGQIIVARVGDEVTVKRFKRESRQIVWLLPENPKFKPIKVDMKKKPLVIEGLAVGIIRNRKL